MRYSCHKSWRKNPASMLIPSPFWASALAVHFLALANKSPLNSSPQMSTTNAVTKAVETLRVMNSYSPHGFTPHNDCGWFSALISLWAYSLGKRCFILHSARWWTVAQQTRCFHDSLRNFPLTWSSLPSNITASVRWIEIKCGTWCDYLISWDVILPVFLSLTFSLCGKQLFQTHKPGEMLLISGLRDNERGLFLYSLELNNKSKMYLPGK